MAPDTSPTAGAATPASRLAAWSWRVLAALVALWFVMSLTYPFGWDQGILSWAGGVVLHGGMPYRDAWDMKGPLAYLVFAGSQALFGVHLWGIRLIDAALLASAAIVIARVVTSLTSREAGWWSGLIFALWYASHSYWHTAQPDGWAAMLMAVALLPLASPAMPRRAVAFAVGGVAVGLLSLIKPTYAIFLALPVVAARYDRGRQAFAALGLCLAGWLLPIAATAAWFASQGAVGDLVDVYVRYPATAYGQLGGADLVTRLRGLVEFLFQAPAALAVPIALVGALELWRPRRQASVVLGLWTVLVVGMVALQGRYFAYHWLPVLPPLVVLGAVGVHAALPRARSLGLAVLVAFVVACLLPILVEQVRFGAWLTGRTDRAVYYDGYGEPGAEMRALDWLEGRPPGKVFVFGWNTAVAWLSGRDVVTRFGFSMPLMLGDGLPVRAEYRAEAMRVLRDDPPRYIIVGPQSTQILRRTMTVDDFPELADLLRRSYGEPARFGAIRIHERLDVPGAAGR